MDEQDCIRYDFSLDINGVRLLKGVIDYAIEKWPGAPQRPHEEQEFLWSMRDEVNRCMLEHTFNNLE
jgi:hypothetical protein